MFCRQCGKELNDGAKFCSGCGSKITSVQPEFIQDNYNTNRSSMDPSSVSVRTNQQNGMSKGLIVAIVLVGIAIIAVIIAVVVVITSKFFANKTGNIDDVIYSEVIEEELLDGDDMYDDDLDDYDYYDDYYDDYYEDTSWEYVFPDSDVRRLTHSDLMPIANDKFMLAVARNEMYARYGYQFTTNQAMIEYFSSKSWYYPTTTDQRAIYSRFTQIEKDNIDLIKSYEEALD